MCAVELGHVSHRDDGAADAIAIVADRPAGELEMHAVRVHVVLDDHPHVVGELAAQGTQQRDLLAVEHGLAVGLEHAALDRDVFADFAWLVARVDADEPSRGRVRDHDAAVLVAHDDAFAGALEHGLEHAHAIGEQMLRVTRARFGGDERRDVGRDAERLGDAGVAVAVERHLAYEQRAEVAVGGAHAKRVFFVEAVGKSRDVLRVRQRERPIVLVHVVHDQLERAELVTEQFVRRAARPGHALVQRVQDVDRARRQRRDPLE
jgi:hypothetical protein